MPVFKFVFAAILLLNSTAASSIETTPPHTIIEQIRAETLPATSPKLGALWFQNHADREETFKSLHKWVYNEEDRKLASIKTVILSSTPEYCFDIRQARTVRFHINFLKKMPSYEQYEKEMVDIEDALQALKDLMIKNAEKKANSTEDTDFTKELVRRAELSKITQERNQLLFQLGIDKKLSEPAWYFLQERVILNLCEFDYQNSEWIKKTLAEITWPTISKYGETADKYAAFLVRRSYDNDFKIAVAENLKDTFAAGEINSDAYLAILQSIKIIKQIDEKSDAQNSRVFMCHAP